MEKKTEMKRKNADIPIRHFKNEKGSRNRLHCNIAEIL